MKKLIISIVLCTFIFSVNAAWFHQVNLAVSKTGGTPIYYSKYDGNFDTSTSGNLGTISDGVLKLAGDAYIGRGGFGSMATLNYRIDNQSIISKNLSWDSGGHYQGGDGYYADKFVFYEFNALEGMILDAGTHTITIFYTGVGNNPPTVNNGSSSQYYIKVTFTIPEPPSTVDLSSVVSSGYVIKNGIATIQAEFEGSAAIELYTINGTLLKKTVAVDSFEQTGLLKGLYVIKINGEASKVLVE